MEWLLWIVVVVILGLAAVAGSGRFGAMPPPVFDAPVPSLPEGALGADDLREVQFAVVTRGYSMTQVDELLERLARQLEDGDAGFASSAIMTADDAFAEAPPTERKRGTDGSDEAPHG